MGPLILVDKSFLQSLNDELIDFLGRHYFVLISPILLQEICANLLKFPDDPNLSKDKVKKLALKSYRVGKTISRFEILCMANLNGVSINFTTQIPTFNFNEIVLENGEKGIVLQPSFEDKLLKRWSEGEFIDTDIKILNEIYKLREYDLAESKKTMAIEFPRNTHFKSIIEILKMMDDFNTIPDSSIHWNIIEGFCNMLFTPNLPPPSWIKTVKERWERINKPTFDVFSPYAFFCYKILAAYFTGITAGLVETSKHKKTIIDYQYLFYLPFVNIFCSNDNFHLEFAKYFIRPDQEIIQGEILRSDLINIASCYKNMNDEERTYYEANFGYYPPPIPDSITYLIWQKYMKPWKERSGNLLLTMTKEEKITLEDHVKKLFKDII